MKYLEEEAQRATQLLRHKVVDTLWRHRQGEVMIQFTDGVGSLTDDFSEDDHLSAIPEHAYHLEEVLTVK